MKNLKNLLFLFCGVLITGCWGRMTDVAFDDSDIRDTNLGVQVDHGTDGVGTDSSSSAISIGDSDTGVTDTGTSDAIYGTDTETNTSPDENTDHATDHDSATGPDTPGDTGSDTEAVSETSSDTGPPIDTETNTELESSTDSESEPDTEDTNSDTQEDYESEYDTVSEIENDTNSTGDTEADSATEVDTDSDTNSDSESESESESDSYVDSDECCGENCINCTEKARVCDVSSADCVPKACSDDSECPEPDYVCNVPWGYCVVAGCENQPDFTRCNVVSEPNDRSFDICSAGECVSPGCGTPACNVPGLYFTIPDTNQRECYDMEAAIPCPSSPSDDFYGQDAQYCWDVDHTADERYTRNLVTPDEPVVEDNITGLIWQGCPSGLSGEACDEDLLAEFNWEQAVAYCENLAWGGYDDWRLPDVGALASITDSSNPSKESFFPGKPNTWFWSSTTYLGYTDNSGAWGVNYDNRENAVKKNAETPYPARCVRGDLETYISQPRFVRRAGTAEEWIVKDYHTNLMWFGCMAGRSGADCEVGDGITMTWAEALLYCKNSGWAGYANWRMPSRNELAGIVDRRKAYPAIDSAFPETPAPDDIGFWSSTTYANSHTYAWGIMGHWGHIWIGEKETPRYLRCVRDDESK